MNKKEAIVCEIDHFAHIFDKQVTKYFQFVSKIHVIKKLQNIQRIVKLNNSKSNKIIQTRFLIEFDIDFLKL